jgi:hypothetical protein
MFKLGNFHHCRKTFHSNTSTDDIDFDSSELPPMATIAIAPTDDDDVVVVVVVGVVEDGDLHERGDSLPLQLLLPLSVTTVAFGILFLADRGGVGQDD